MSGLLWAVAIPYLIGVTILLVQAYNDYINLRPAIIVAFGWPIIILHAAGKKVF